MPARSLAQSYRLAELQPAAGHGLDSNELAENIHRLPGQDLHVIGELQDLRVACIETAQKSEMSGTPHR